MVLVLLKRFFSSPYALRRYYKQFKYLQSICFGNFVDLKFTLFCKSRSTILLLLFSFQKLKFISSRIPVLLKLSSCIITVTFQHSSINNLCFPNSMKFIRESLSIGVVLFRLEYFFSSTRVLRGY